MPVFFKKKRGNRDLGKGGVEYKGEDRYHSEERYRLADVLRSFRA